MRDFCLIRSSDICMIFSLIRSYVSLCNSFWSEVLTSLCVFVWSEVLISLCGFVRSEVLISLCDFVRVRSSESSQLDHSFLFCNMLHLCFSSAHLGSAPRSFKLAWLLLPFSFNWFPRFNFHTKSFSKIMKNSWRFKIIFLILSNFCGIF